MPLATGTKLGPYEIESPAGAGGMGEVYRARDTRLGRTVAIKILPQNLSEKPDAQERFDREARAISSLSHANICQLYDVGRQNGISYLVMEYLDGETLADRLYTGPLPLDHVLRYSIEICEGLEKAHRNGVLHRDLKPGNIMLTSSGAKLMDFGLAKAMLPGAPNAALTETLVTPNQRPLTTEGTVVGTYQYMSPEQVEGKGADARSDIFSFGVVLYEMITGKRAFEGGTPASTIAAILAADPPSIASLQPTSPPALDHVVKVCLRKNPDDRWQGVHDVKVQLQWIVASGSQSGMPTADVKRNRWHHLAFLLASSLVLILLAGTVAWWMGGRRSQPTMYFSSVFPFPANNLALSPDGQTLAMVAYWDQENTYVLWIYKIGARSIATLQGTEGASYPFWSADGKSIAFFAQGKLKKVSASGGPAQVLCDAPIGRGGAWNRDGVILFSPDVFGGLYRVPSGGGTPLEVTKVDRSRFEQSHRWPVFLPDGRHFLYTAANFGGRFDANAIYVGSLDSNEKRLILAASSNSAFADPGYLFYWRDGVLVTQKFDPRSYALTGDPHTVSDDVQYLPQVDLALFAVAGKEALVLQTGTGGAQSQLTWFDRAGTSLGTVGPPGYYANPRLSPDGRRVAFDQVEGRNVDIWIRDATNGAATRFTFGPSLQDDAVWSPDGGHIIFAANRNAFRLFEKNTDGSGPEQDFADVGADQQLPWDWSRDGKYVLVRKKNELWYVTLPDRQLRPFLQPAWMVRNAQFSPDGKWVAYSSNETGTFEVFISPFPNPLSKWQVSSKGGDEPHWRRDGKELFYLSPEGKMMAVPVETGTGGFMAKSPIALFQTRRWQLISAQDVFSYDVTADGKRFLINTKVSESNSAPLSIILHWASDMEH